MNNNPPAPLPAKNSRPAEQSYFDLILYLVGGIGSYLLVSASVGLIFEELSITATFLLFLANFICLGGTTLLLGVWRGKVTLADLGLRPLFIPWTWLIIGGGVALVLLPVRGLIGLLVQLIVAGDFESLQARSDIIMGGALEFSWTGFLLTFIGVGILVPISEELYFRGLLHTWFWSKSRRVWLRVLLSTLVFGAAHYDTIGVVAASAIIGVVNAIAYERTRSLVLPIVVHMTTNGTAAILLYTSLALMEALPNLMP